MPLQWVDAPKIKTLEMLSALAFKLVTSSGLSLKKAVVVPHHVGIEMPPIAHLHCADILEEPLTMLIAHSAKVG